MPCVVVHCLEGDTTRLDGPYTRRSQRAGGDQEGQPGNAFSSVDSHTPAICRVPDSSTFQHFERCTAACCISWEIFGAAACSPTGEHDPVGSGRAIRRCLFADAIDGTPDECFGCHTSSAWTSPTANARMMDTLAQTAPRLTEQDPWMAARAVVFDCCPALLPVSLDVSGIDMPQSGLQYRLQRLMLSVPHMSSHSRGRICLA